MTGNLPGGCGARRSRRGAARALLAILLAALLIRVVHALAAVMISPDSAVFIDYARDLSRHPLDALRSYHQHPLYPALLLCVHPLAALLTDQGPAGWILAGRIVAIAGSLGAVAALYALASGMYGRRRGLLAALLLAVLPDAARIGANVLSDLPHLAFYLAGLAALLAGLQRDRRRWFALAGLAAGLAFLTRPEGASVVVVGAALLAIRVRRPLRGRLARAAILLAAFACIAGPYQLATGKLIPKKSPQALFKLASKPGSRFAPHFQGTKSTRHVPPATCHLPFAAAALPIPVDVLRQWARSARVVYLLLAVLGALVARPHRRGGRVLSAAIGLHILLLCALEHSFGYLDRRHALILTALALPPAAAGMWWLAGRISLKLRGVRAALRLRAVAGLMAGCLAVTGYWLALPINVGEDHVRATAAWIAAHTEPGAEIVTDDRLHRVALCADRRFVRWPWWSGDAGRLARFLKQRESHGPCYFLVESRHMTLPERNPRFFEDFRRTFGDRMELLHTEPAPPGATPTEIRVYRYRPVDRVAGDRP